VEGTPLAFRGSKVAIVIFTLLTIVEYITDQLPSTPARTAPMQLVARLIMGALSGACICVSAGQWLLVGAVVGAVGAVIGAYGGYEGRNLLVNGLKVKDIFIAIPEDLVAMGLASLASRPQAPSCLRRSPAPPNTTSYSAAPMAPDFWPTQCGASSRTGARSVTFCESRRRFNPLYRCKLSKAWTSRSSVHPMKTRLPGWQPR